jgi:hypothetical protein
MNFFVDYLSAFEHCSVDPWSQHTDLRVSSLRCLLVELVYLYLMCAMQNSTTRYTKTLLPLFSLRKNRHENGIYFCPYRGWGTVRSRSWPRAVQIECSGKTEDCNENLF